MPRSVFQISFSLGTLSHWNLLISRYHRENEQWIGFCGFFLRLWPLRSSTNASRPKKRFRSPLKCFKPFAFLLAGRTPLVICRSINLDFKPFTLYCTFARKQLMIPGYGSKHKVHIILDTQTIAPMFSPNEHENSFFLAVTSKDTPFDVVRNSIRGQFIIIYIIGILKLTLTFIFP